MFVFALCTAGGVACHDWETALTTVLGRLDGGSMPESDGGNVDAGCQAALCLRQTFKTGAVFRDVQPLPDGTFLTVGVSWVSANFVAVIDDGGITFSHLPIGVFDPWSVAGTGLEQYFVASNSGAVIHRNRGSIVDDDCGLTGLNPYWHAVSAVPGKEAVFAGNDSAVCVVSPDGGAVGLNLSTLSSPAEEVAIASVLTFASGERFMVGWNGAQIYWKPPGPPMLTRHPLGASQSLYWVAVAGQDLGSVWAVGHYGMLARWEPNGGDGGSWKEEPLIPLTTDEPEDLWVVDNDDLWVVGDKGFIKHFDGGTWANITADGVGSETWLKSVAASGKNNLVLAGYERFADGGQEGVLFYYERGPRP